MSFCSSPGAASTTNGRGIEMENEHNAAIWRQSPYCDILAMIPRGAKNARYSDEIAPVLGLSKRSLCKHIEQLRRSGIVIIGNGGGYFLPADLEELEGYIAQEQKRARSVLYTLKSARTLKQRWTENIGNYSLFD